MSERLKALAETGVSIWLDDMSRERIETGNLADLVKDSSVVGVTTNPTIFATALSDGERYDDQVRAPRQGGQGRRRRDLRDHHHRRPRRLRRARRHLRGDRRSRRPGVDRGCSRARPRRAGDHRLRQGAVGGGGPAEPVHQDPGDHRGRPRDHRPCSPRASASTSR